MSEPAAKSRPMIDLDEFERRLRRPAAATHAQEDPLVELARLVGGHEDPFKTVFEDGGSARAQQMPHAAIAADPYAPESYAQENYAGEEPAFHGTIHPQAYGHEEPALTPAHESDYYEQQPAEAQDYTWPEAEAPAAAMHQPAEASRSRRPLFAMAAIIAAGILGIGVSFAYKSKSGPHEIATIKALSGPTKVQPESPGGMDVPNQDASILNKSPQPTPTRLANHEERPVDLAIQQSAPPPKPMMADATMGTTGAASVPVPVPPAGTQAPAAAPQQDIQSYGIGALIEPKKVKTVSVRSDGTLLPNDTPPQMPASASPAPHSAVVPPAAAVTPKPASTPKSTARVVTTPKPAPSIEQLADAGNTAPVDAPAISAPAPVKPKPTPAKPVKVARAEPAETNQSPAEPAEGGGAFAVQLAAPGSEQEAHEMTAKLAAKFGSDLSGHHLTYHRAKVGEKTVYRVRASGMSREEATSICVKVQSSGGSCFVAKS